MKIIPQYDFTTAPIGSFTPADEASFRQDVEAAINIFDATFTNDITLTLNFGLGSINGRLMKPEDGEDGGLGSDNAAVLVTYSQLRDRLMTSGQPGFFNAANLPAGDSINGMSNFWVSSSQAKALGLPLQKPGLVDGFIGFAVGAFGVGTGRIAEILHEIGHAMGRYPGNVDSLGRGLPLGPNDNPPNPQGPIFVSALDLVRFITPGNRLFDGNLKAPTPAYFSVDGGAKKVALWAAGDSPSDFLKPPDSNLSPNDEVNNRVFGPTIAKFTTADIQLMEALGFRVGATAVMVLRSADGFYESYGIGSDAISEDFKLGPVGADWQFVTLGGFNDSSTTSDMLLRNSTTGAFEVYNISNDQITGSADIGTVGLEWQFFGVGNFNGIPGKDFPDNPGNTDMMLRNRNTGSFEIYNIEDNEITDTFLNPLSVGLNCQFSGIGNFSGIPGASDMILRDANSGKFFLYNVSNDAITFAREIGNVGLNWQFSGVGNFSSNPGESDMILRNTNTGELLVYNISNNRITGSFSIGTVGLDWQFAGVAPIRVPGASDLVLRNSTTGALQVYNIANNQITGSELLGTVGTDWQLGGFAPTASNGFMRNSGNPLASGPQPSAGSTSQLVQAMAGFGGGSGAGESLNAAPLGADTSQQTFLTTPQHA